MCVCVFSSHSFWTSSSSDVPAGVTQEEGHTGFLIHILSAVRALIFLARMIQPFLSLVDREVEFLYSSITTVGFSQVYVCMYVCMYGHHIWQSMDQPGNPARGQLNRVNNIPLSPCVSENLVLRDGFSRPVPRQPAHLRTQAESGAYLRDYSRVPRRRPFMKPPYAIGSVPSLSGRAIAYRWRSLPRVRRHRASKPQGGSERVLP